MHEFGVPEDALDNDIICLMSRIGFCIRQCSGGTLLPITQT